MASALQIVQSESNDQIRLNNNAPCELREISTNIDLLLFISLHSYQSLLRLCWFSFFFSFFLLQYLLVYFKSAAGGRGRNKTRFIRYFSFNLTIRHVVNDVPLSTTINIDSDRNLTNSVIYLCYLPGQIGSITKKKKKNQNYLSYTCIYLYYIIFTVSINIKINVYTFFKSVFYKNTISRIIPERQRYCLYVLACVYVCMYMKLQFSKRRHI